VSDEGTQLDDKTRAAIGKRLAEALKRRGVSQVAAAKLVGRTRQAVNHWVKGRNLLDTYALYKIITEYHLSADYILTGSEAAKLAQTITNMPAEQRRELATIFAPPVSDKRVLETGYRPRK
jgi:transcriptional regulator with XRE-family HTH domain